MVVHMIHVVYNDVAMKLRPLFSRKVDARHCLYVNDSPKFVMKPNDILLAVLCYGHTHGRESEISDMNCILKEKGPMVKAIRLTHKGHKKLRPLEHGQNLASLTFKKSCVTSETCMVRKNDFFKYVKTIPNKINISNKE